MGWRSRLSLGDECRASATHRLVEVFTTSGPGMGLGPEQEDPEQTRAGEGGVPSAVASPNNAAPTVGLVTAVHEATGISRDFHHHGAGEVVALRRALKLAGA